MSNNGTHFRKRTTHPSVSQRDTHSPLAFDAIPSSNVETVDQTVIDGVVGAQNIIPGSVGSGAIQPGALTLPSFAATLRPVHIVTSLPALPSADYPVGSVAVLTTDGKLYRNDANAWTAVVDADDIVATSVVAGAVTAGAISVQDIIIHDGHLIFSDQFGSTVLDGAGFGQTWRRFVASGFLNGDFAAGLGTNFTVSEVSGGDSDADYAASLSAQLPHWIVKTTDPDVTLVTIADVDAESGRALKATGSGAGGFNEVYQDISVVSGNYYKFKIVYKVDWSANVEVNITGFYRDAAHAAINSALIHLKTHTSDALTYATYEGIIGPVPANARYIRFNIKTTFSGVGAVWYSGVSAESLPAQGTAFPTNPDDGQRFYRTDYRMEFAYSSLRSQWESTQLYQTTNPEPIVLSATTGNVHILPMPPRLSISLPLETKIFVENVHVLGFIAGGGSALGVLHKWEALMRAFNSAGGEFTMSFGLGFTSGSSGVWRETIDTANFTMETTTHIGINFDWTKTGTPGNLTLQATTIQWRYVAD